MDNMIPISREKNAGFTAIEILIVVCIIGILSSIAIPIFLDQKDKAIIGVTKANMEVMRSGLSQYAAGNSNNLYPSGNLHYIDFRTTVPGTNLPPLESEAKILSGSFLYSSDGTTYYLQATSTNRSTTHFTASPSGVIRQ
jgi:prepilin-type N-terminal cleavage/methylation domain-containing protein